MNDSKKWRDFNKFMGETLKNFFAIAKKEKKRKTSWSDLFADLRKNRFNNISRLQYNNYIAPKDKPIKKGSNMEDIIKNDLGEDFAKKFVEYREIPYLNPGERKDMSPPHGEKLCDAWIENIETFITGELKDNKQITETPAIQQILTDGFNRFHGTGFEDLEEVYNYAHKTYKNNTSKESAERARDAATWGLNKGREEKKKAKDYVDDTAEEVETTKEIKYSSDDEEDPRDKAKSAAEQIDAKIKEDAIITRAALDNEFYSQLPEDIKQILKNKIDEKKTIIERSKVIRYLLPKERPKWETATMNKGMNPMLARGAWRV